MGHEMNGGASGRRRDGSLRHGGRPDTRLGGRPDTRFGRRPGAASRGLASGLLGPALLITLHASAAPAVQSTGREVREAGRHVVTLRGYDADGTGTEQGSGFHIADGRIATNSHVVEGAARIEIFDADGVRLGTARFAEAIDTRYDLAILPAPRRRGAEVRLADAGTVPAEGGAAAHGLPLGSDAPQVGDPVWVYGSPKGLGGTMSTGIVSAVRTHGDRRLLQISAPVSRGSSGGPVLNGRGEVIGVTVSSVPGAQNLNFAVPAARLARLAASSAGRISFPDPAEPSPARDGSGRPDGAGDHLPDRWKFLARNASDADLFFDRESLSRRDGSLRVWIYTLYPTTQTAGSSEFDASKALFEIRCGAHEFRLNQYLLLRGDQVIASDGSVGDGVWSAIAPDSVAEGLLLRVCS